MATTVYETQEVQLIDGTTISVRPLKISLLREFLKKFETIADVSADNNKSNRKSTRLNSSHVSESRMPSSA